MESVKHMDIITDENKAEKFLREKGILKTFISCPYCETQQLWKSKKKHLQMLQVQKRMEYKKRKHP
ncbi:hypothetical protein [Thermodesulfobacterium hydrogeniphilum]|uniref:hypothetical protein n=1 Tax=Thermodesulfobacterium hydrogeniphilum TaxID=161156 RepID=UPI000571FE38|nr:hypothetical protein [Thermodesulfobacterium hydrogeniphilum]